MFGKKSNFGDEQMEYTQMFREVLNSMRENLEFCDGTIVSSDKKEYSVHRIVLCGESKELTKLYLEAERDNKSTIIVDIRSSILEHILEGLYIGEFPFNPDEIRTWGTLIEVFQAATLLDLISLKLLCLDFINIQLMQDDCYIMDFYRLVSSDEVHKDMKRILLQLITTNFPHVTNKWELSGSDLIDILSDELLHTRNEEQVVQVIEEWLRFNYEIKDEYLLKFCKCVRIDQLKSPTESFKYISEINSSKENISGTLNQPRVPYHLIFVHGGWHHLHPICDMEVFDPRTNSWMIESKRTPFIRSYHSLVVFEKIIYSIGGFDGRRYFATVTCFDPVAQSWRYKSCMQYKRCYLSSCVLGEYIYCFGGYNGIERLSSAERYHPHSNQWEILPPMSTERSDASCCAIGNQIFITGGFDGYGVLRTVEKFDLKTWQWTTVASLNLRRSGLSLVFISNALHAIGGFDGFRRLASWEEYSFERDIWTKKNKNMINCRSNFGCVSSTDTIYVFGGFDGISTIPYCECYNMNSKKWTELPDLKVRRSAIAACSVYELDTPAVKQQ